jgi:endoglucanase
MSRRVLLLVRALALSAGLLLLGMSGGPAEAAPSRPFPQHQVYAPGSIKPSHVSQAALDQTATQLYGQWKSGFLRAGCTPGRYYVWHGGYGGGGTGDRVIAVSEGLGYGMLITVLMAGQDPAAQTLFDGLYAWFRDHPSVNHPDLMAWQQLEGCASSSDADSATDGDLDIAYALLLADRQWGSGGAVNYKAEGAKVVAAVRAKEVHPRTQLVQLGDWVGTYDAKTYNATRTSDWMPTHFRAFQAATGQAGWQGTLDATYSLLATLQKKLAPKTGLVPDFVVNTNTTPKAAPSGFLGEDTGNLYGWNACRTPWRIASDFLLHGEPRARTAVRKLEDWARTATGGKPAKLRAGYTLAGKAVASYSDLAFTAPLAVGAMVDASYQPWLNALWDATTRAGFDPKDYYGDTLRLLAVLTISGNVWKP